MSDHNHREFVEGCFRCDLSRDEVRRGDLDEMERLARRLRDRGFPKLAPVVRSDLVLRAADALEALIERVKRAESEVVKITANRDDWASRMMELGSVTQRAERAESVIAEALDVARSASVPLGVPEAMHYNQLLAETRRVLSTYEKGATQ